MTGRIADHSCFGEAPIDPTGKGVQYCFAAARIHLVHYTTARGANLRKQSSNESSPIEIARWILDHTCDGAGSISPGATAVPGGATASPWAPPAAGRRDGLDTRSDPGGNQVAAALTMDSRSSADELVDDMAHLRGVAFQEIPPGRDIEEKVLHGDAAARRERGGFLADDAAIFYLDEGLSTINYWGEQDYCRQFLPIINIKVSFAK